MKENRKLLKEVLKDIRHDMSDEEVLNLLADSKISVSPESEKEKYTLGQRAADVIAKFAGSWAFIFSFTGVLVLWMIVNTLLAAKAFDPYPFILLNLVLSCVAAIQAPLIMMSQNRQENLRVLSRSLALVGLIGGGMMVCFMVVPSFWVNMLVGGAYTTFSHWLPLLSIMMFLASINNVLVSYLLAMRRRGVLVAIGMGVVALSVGLTLSGAHIKGLISSYVVANIIMAVILLVQVYVKKGSVK
jgi:hypothetical protein